MPCRKLIVVAALPLLACGSVAGEPATDGGPRATAVPPTLNEDGGPPRVRSRDGGGPPTPGFDGGRPPVDAGRESSVSSLDARGGVDGGFDATLGGGGSVDAGYYHGDGSFFVDGGAYRDAGATPDGWADAKKASDSGALGPSCAALAACCATLHGSSQALCENLVAQGNEPDCQAEESQLRGGGSCTGVSILASDVQAPPNRMASDGTTLFWTTTATPGLLAMPVHGGPVRIVLEGPITNSLGTAGQASDAFLAVDSVNIYVLQHNSLVRIPKDGGPATLLNDRGAIVVDATCLDGTAYWVENPGGPVTSPSNVYPVRSAPLLGGPSTLIAAPTYPGLYSTNQIAVTGRTVFMGNASVAYPPNGQLFAFPTAMPSTGLMPVMLVTVQNPGGCTFVTSDTQAIYCASEGLNDAISAEGGLTLGPSHSTMPMVVDDTYVYWADNVMAGSIMKETKPGGATPTLLATDANPTAIAVDATSVYWGDQGGTIKSVPK